jgi:hypothetical protein
MALTLAGRGVEIESPSGEGIADMIVPRPETSEVFVIEMKKAREIGEMDTSLAAAMSQIDEKKYDLKYRGSVNKIYKTALAIGGRLGARIAFEDADNWQLMETDEGLKIVFTTRDKEPEPVKDTNPRPDNGLTDHP